MTYGCHNRGHFRAQLQVQDGWNQNGTRRMITISVRSSASCQYDLRTTDKRCAGCRWAAV